MMDLKQHCKGMDEKLADLLLDPASVPAEVRDHVAQCDGCGRELKELRATMGLMEAWQAPEPSPYFFTRLHAQMREERQTASHGWFARLKASFSYGPQRHMRPLAAMALTVLLLLGGGTYLSISDLLQPKPQMNDAAVVNDLQTLENNAQVLDTLENLTSSPDHESY